MISMMVAGGLFFVGAHEAGGFAVYWESLSLVKKIAFAFFPGLIVLPLIGGLIFIVFVSVAKTCLDLTRKFRNRNDF